jgi:hypothetical protein
MVLHPGITNPVGCAPSMLAAIELDDEVVLVAEEVGDVRAEGDLAAKNLVGKAIAEVAPEGTLVWGLVGS